MSAEERALLVRALEALKWTLDHHKKALADKPHSATHSICYAESVLSHPLAQQLLGEVDRG